LGWHRERPPVQRDPVSTTPQVLAGGRIEPGSGGEALRGLNQATELDVQRWWRPQRESTDVASWKHGGSSAPRERGTPRRRR